MIIVHPCGKAVPQKQKQQQQSRSKPVKQMSDREFAKVFESVLKEHNPRNY